MNIIIESPGWCAFAYVAVKLIGYALLLDCLGKPIAKNSYETIMRIFYGIDCAVPLFILIVLLIKGVS